VSLPGARDAVVVLVDGLGELLLQQRGGHAPFLRQLRTSGAVAEVLTSGFPSTTATSMGMFGTGRVPGQHGLVGLEVLDPERDRLFNELAWDPGVDPRRWQPGTTVFEDVVAAGRDVVRIGPGHFDGSGLTEATLRGGRFVPAATLAGRVDAALAALRGPRPRGVLVYLYWGEVDKTGHEHGCGSWQWGEELGATDAELGRLARLLPRGTLLAVTADHGMVDVPIADRVDVAHEAPLATGVRHVGGEPRALHLYCEPGAAERVQLVWQDRLDGSAQVLCREDAVRADWFGDVAAHVLPRIGDVVVSVTGGTAVVDSRTARPELLRLVGLHGAATPQEQLVPLLATLTGS
jgi:hypothetical protein